MMVFAGQRSTVIVAAGQGAWEHAMLADANALRRILDAEDVPHWTGLWGCDVDHDWPWWRRMMPHFHDGLELPACASG